MRRREPKSLKDALFLGVARALLLTGAILAGSVALDLPWLDEADGRTIQQGTIHQKETP